MHTFIMSIIGSLIKLLWVFSSASKKTEPLEEKKEEDENMGTEKLVSTDGIKLNEKTAEIIEEASRLDAFLNNIQDAKSPEERLNLLIEFEEDEKMRELLIKMRGH